MIKNFEVYEPYQTLFVRCLKQTVNFVTDNFDKLYTGIKCWSTQCDFEYIFLYRNDVGGGCTQAREKINRNSIGDEDLSPY
jgi:hypothetical protein